MCFLFKAVQTLHKTACREHDEFYRCIDEANVVIEITGTLSHLGNVRAIWNFSSLSKC